jgi:PAS domain S-box-containing protein
MRWQRGGFEVFGISFGELEKLHTPIPLIHPEDQERVRAIVDEMVATHGPLHIEYRVIFPNGDLHWNEARGTFIPGRYPCWRGATFDITESKLAENALLRSEKLAAMGRLASTVAHEINNPLEAVTNLLYLARTDSSLSPASQGYLATAEAELGRLADITRLTLGFVRNSSSPATSIPARPSTRCCPSFATA